MACEDGEFKEENGRYYKCVGGQWVRLRRRPPGPGTGPGSLVVDEIEALNSPEIVRAIEDPRKQVVVQIFELTDEVEG